MKKLILILIVTCALVFGIVLLVHPQNVKNVSTTQKISNTGNIGNADRPDETPPSTDIGNRPIKGGYGVGLIIDTTDPQSLASIQNFINALKSHLVGDKAAYYVRGVPTSDQLRPFQLFIALGPSVPATIKQYIYKDNPLLYSSRVVEYEKKEDPDTVAQRLLQIMGENSVAHALFVHNTTSISQADIGDMFEQLYY